MKTKMMERKMTTVDRERLGRLLHALGEAGEVANEMVCGHGRDCDCQLCEEVRPILEQVDQLDDTLRPWLAR
jgi:hypothetical protein